MPALAHLAVGEQSFLERLPEHEVRDGRLFPADQGDDAHMFARLGLPTFDCLHVCSHDTFPMETKGDVFP